MDKRITLEVMREDSSEYRVTGLIDDWIIAMYWAMTPAQQDFVRAKLNAAEERRRRE